MSISFFSFIWHCGLTSGSERTKKKPWTHLKVARNRLFFYSFVLPSVWSNICRARESGLVNAHLSAQHNKFIHYLMNTIFTSTELCIHFRLTARTCSIFVMCECLNQKTTLFIPIRIIFWFCSHNLCPIIVVNYLISVRVYIWPVCFLFVCVKNRQLTENEMNKWPENVNVLVKGE